MLTSSSRIDVFTRLGRAMADPSRARILAALTDGPAYPAELADVLGMTRSNVSNHLACLRGCGLVLAETEGRRTRYAIADAHLAHALTALVEVVLAVDDGTPCANDTCDVPGCCADCDPGPVARVIGDDRIEVRA
ncbi:Cd(II)/Pb(II)-sensing metalloregulatory transcriptional regulator CmtR [Cellulomonas hominis]|uniref:Cd(II)/Pb(II)-sensing metalloregulatory transcriptional regulator CmtR n=1 Tax=Cellulomonas hominis TaxID=156981 RepID=UPI0014448B01|nr:metalloregulator ArsR/SmtB family transcription factor [Cellulomonas hominis]NKY09598.1 winged helix-turn-helix transcriptional regulator [Cellulomonas hominis]